MAIDPETAGETQANEGKVEEDSEGEDTLKRNAEDLRDSTSTDDAEQANEKKEGESTEEGEGEGEGEGEEEPGECPFCLFMKGGPCRDNFIQWEECVQTAEDAKEDIVEKCHQITFLLKECMESNSEYYEPVLQAEKAMGDAILEESSSLSASQEENDGQISNPALQDAGGNNNNNEKSSSNEDENKSSAVEAQTSEEVESRSSEASSQMLQDGNGSSENSEGS